MRRPLRLVLPLLLTLAALATLVARRAGPGGAAPAQLRSVPAAPWVDPQDGRCPEGYLVKAKLRSGIYHLPSGRHYNRTVPDRCYRSGADAEADGLRAAQA